MQKNNIPNHVAIIMDGNGRWAKNLEKNRTFGHNEGSKRISDVSKFAIKSGINFLTLFAFSTENWNRPKLEIQFLLKLFNKIISSKKTFSFLKENNIKFKWLGFKDNLSSKIIKKIKLLEKFSEKNSSLVLTIAFNYSGKLDIIKAGGEVPNKLISSFLPDIDLLIRTGNEQRISNFLLWHLAYSEFVFEKTLWPNYSYKIWIKNLNDFKKRNRRFGKI